MCCGEGAGAGVFDLAAFEEGDQEFYAGLYVVRFERFEEGAQRRRLAEDLGGHLVYFSRFLRLVVEGGGAILGRCKALLSPVRLSEDLHRGFISLVSQARVQVEL